MNRRIRKLAESTDRACEHLGRSDIGEEWLEKFAELIVQECVNVLDNQHESFKGNGEYGEYGRGFKSGLSAASRTVKGHFEIAEHERRKSKRRKGYEHPAEGTTRAIREVKNRRTRQRVDFIHRICEHGRDAYADDCGMCDAAGTNWAWVDPKQGRKK